MLKLRLLLLILFIAAISGCNDKEPEKVSDGAADQGHIQVTATQAFSVPEPSTVYVEIRGSMFEPDELKVINGTTVRWKNSDSAVYVINVDNFSSPNLSKRDTWNHTFTKIGTFEYNCSLHPAMPGGRIIVEESAR